MYMYVTLFSDQTVLRSDTTAGTILKMNYDGSSKAVFYTLPSGSVYDMKVVGDYIYYVVSSTSRLEFHTHIIYILFKTRAV